MPLKAGGRTVGTVLTQNPPEVQNPAPETQNPQSHLPVTPVETAPSTDILTPENVTLAGLNPNLGLEGIGESNVSRITADGTELVYKKYDGLRVTELFIPGNTIIEGKRYWQWWPKKDDQGNQVEEGGMCMSYDHKTSTDGLICANCPHFKDKSCKMKYDLVFSEFDEASGESVEHTLTMSTTSAIAWIEYVKALTRGETASKDDRAYLQSPRDPRKPVTFGPNGNNNGWYVKPDGTEFRLGGPTPLSKVITRVTVKRVEKNIDGRKVIYSQMVFQAVGFVEEAATA